MNVNLESAAHNNSETLNRFLRRSLFSIALLEIFLGGGGRLFNVGFLSLRMYIFGLLLILGALFFFRKPRMGRPVFELLFLAAFVILFGSLIGIFNHHKIGLIFEDIRPLLSIFSMIFFVYAIRSMEDVELVIKLIRISSVVLAVSYLVIFFLINFKLVPFSTFYTWASSTEEFFFRGEFAFFYKGFLYLCIGFFFFNWRDGFYSKIALSIISLAVVLTFTRGFVISLFLVYLFYLIFIKKKFIILLIITLSSLVAAPYVWDLVSNSAKLDRKKSDQSRFSQINEVFQNTTIASSLVGHGFGENISSRQDLHLEIAYLEIFYKQGIVGLSFWFYFIFLIGFYFYKCMLFGNAALASPFFLASLFTTLQSFTNPFINNPIGMTCLIVSLVCLRILSKQLVETQSKFF